MKKEIDPRILIAVIAVLVLALVGAGWRFFRSGANQEITMPVNGQIRL